MSVSSSSGPAHRPSQGRVVHRSEALQKRREEFAAHARPASSTIYDWSGSLAAPAVQLKAFDRAIGDLHDSVALGNHRVWGDPLPAHLQYKKERAARESADAHTIAADGVASPGTALPHGDVIQEAFGHHDISRVEAHVGGKATEASEALGAEAYATGSDIAFRSYPTLHTAAHEAAHIVQQRAGVSLKDGIGESGDRYERHADEVADAVVSGRSAEGILDRLSGGSAGASVIQREARGEVAAAEGVDVEALTDELMDLIDMDGVALAVADDGTIEHMSWAITGVAWHVPLPELEYIEITGFGDIVGALQMTKDALLDLAGGADNWKAAGHALMSRSVTVAKHLGFFGQGWMGLPEVALSLQALDVAASTEKSLPNDPASTKAYVKAVLAASHALHEALDNAAATLDLGLAELEGVMKLTFPGKAPVYVKDDESTGYFDESEGQLEEHLAKVRAVYGTLGKEVTEQLRVDGEHSLAAFVSSLLGPGADDSFVGGNVDIGAANALASADAVLATQKGTRAGGVQGRLASLWSAYEALGRASFKVQQYAGLVDAWKAGKLAGATTALTVSRTVRDLCVEILAFAATGPLEAVLTGWRVPSVLVKPLVAGTIEFGKGVVTEVSEKGGDLTKVDYVKISKSCNAAVAEKLLGPIEDALPHYAKKLGFSDFAEQVIPNEHARKALKSALAGALNDTVDVFKGKEVTMDEFMGHVIKNVVLSYPKGRVEDTTKAVVGEGAVGAAAKTIGEGHVECVYDSAVEGANRCDSEQIVRDGVTEGVDKARKNLPGQVVGRAR